MPGKRALPDGGLPVPGLLVMDGRIPFGTRAGFG